MTKKELYKIITDEFFQLPEWKKLCREDIIEFAIDKTIQYSKPKKEGKKISFQESAIYNKTDFATQFMWPKKKAEYYWNSADVWSKEGNKKIDWIGTIKNWERRDVAEGKLKFTEESKEDQLNFFANR